MRLINADALEKTLRNWVRDNWTEAFTGDDAGSEFADMIEHAVTIDANPTVHAHWFTLDPTPRTGRAYKFACSNCNRVVFTRWQESIGELGYAFCPNCGARMDKEGMNT